MILSLYLFLRRVIKHCSIYHAVHSCQLLFILDYPCTDYPVCGLSVHDYKLLTTNDEGGKYRDFGPSARKKILITAVGIFLRTQQA
jgi:hypothetical protein